MPVAFEGRAPLRTTPFGHALLALLRFAWLDGERPELYAHLRSPYSGLQRRDVDWIEGRLRGRGISRGDRAAEVTVELRDGRSLPPLDLVLATRRRRSPPSGALAATMLRNAHGTSAPPLGDAARGGPAGARRRRARARRARGARGARDGASSRAGRPRGARARDRARRARPGRRDGSPCSTCMRARTRRFDTVFVLGLEQGTLPRRASRRAVPRRRGAPRARRAPRRAADAAGRGEPRPLPVRDGVLAAATAARARPPGGRRRGDAARAEPVLGGGAGAVRPGRRPSPDRPPPALRVHLGARGRPDRARAPARARRHRRAGAARGGGARARERLGPAARPCDARVRPPDAAHPRACAPPARRAARRTRVSELERMASCSSAWFVERYLRPATIDKEIDRDDARLDPPRRPAALLPAAAERDPGRRPRHRGERRGGGRADARLRRAGGRDRPSDRRRRPRSARARAGPAARPRAARARRGDLEVAVRAAPPRGVVPLVRARAGRRR